MNAKTEMIKLKPQSNGNGANKKWYHNPYIMGTITAAAIVFGAASLRECGPKPEPQKLDCPEPEPVKCEECCPPGFRKEVSKQPYGLQIKCIDPLTEPRCGDGKCNGNETPKTCPQDCPPVVKPVKEAPAAPAAKPRAIEAPAKSECSEDGAPQITVSEVPQAFRNLAKRAADKLGGVIPGKTVTLRVLLCPSANGERGVSARVLGANVAGESNDEVEKGFRSALDGRKDSNVGIPEAQTYTQFVKVEGAGN